MDEAQDPGDGPPLSPGQASDAVTPLGWRYMLGLLRSSVSVGSLVQAVEVAARVASAAGPTADGHLWLDLRPGRVELSLQTASQAAVTEQDIELARRITDDLIGAGRSLDPGGGSVARSVQVLEIAIDAIDIASVRPFWQAVMGYTDEAGRSGPRDPLVDPVGQGPAIWFQQMDGPRPERNRIHIDVTVPHDEADFRLQAALTAGGTLVTDRWAPNFWVLSDAEGNEACVCTWQSSP
jgi:4a-hydroxytetrahydrobiopterin dehydratase